MRAIYIFAGRLDRLILVILSRNWWDDRMQNERDLFVKMLISFDLCLGGLRLHKEFDNRSSLFSVAILTDFNIAPQVSQINFG